RASPQRGDTSAWTVAAAAAPGPELVDALTENVAVVPTLLALLRVPIDSHLSLDGRPQLDADGHVCPACGKASVYHLWEDYRAIRTRRYLLRQPIPDSFVARCEAPNLLYRVDGARRVRVEANGREQRRFARLRARLGRRLDRREH